MGRFQIKKKRDGTLHRWSESMAKVPFGQKYTQILFTFFVIPDKMFHLTKLRSK